MLVRIALLLMVACQICHAEQKDKPNFLIIVSDDQRPDTIAALGNAVIRTPNLDELAARGTVFTRASCGFPLCVPSRAEILTGKTGFRNGVFQPRGRLHEDLEFWGDSMQRGGYQTWYCGKWMNDGKPTTRGYGRTSALFSSGGGGAEGKKDRYGRKGRLITGYRGWTFKSEDGKPQLEKGIGLTGGTSRYIADGAIEAIGQCGDDPFFVHVNFTAPHDPLIYPPGYENKYDPALVPFPKNFLPRHPFDHGNIEGRDERLLPWPRTESEVRDEIAAYYAVIEDMDAQIGRVLQSLSEAGRLDNTIVVFTSDHGLALGSHGLMGKQNMYDHSILVPFLIAGPGIAEGEQRNNAIHLRDMYPTTCELAGLPIPKGLDATSFVSDLTTPQDSADDACYGYFYDYQRMIRTKRWKLIYYPHLKRYALFDLNNDPHEIRDLANSNQHAAIRDRLNRQMVQWFTDKGDRVFQ